MALREVLGPCVSVVGKRSRLSVLRAKMSRSGVHGSHAHVVFDLIFDNPSSDETHKSYFFLPT